MQALPLCQNIARQLHETVDLNTLRFCGSRSQRRHKFKGSHSAVSCVAQPFNRVKRFRRPPLLPQPGVDDRISELVRKTVRQKPRQTVKTHPRQFRKGIHLRRERHDQRRYFNSRSKKALVILKSSNPSVEQHNADPRSPQINFSSRQASSPHFQFESICSSFLPDALSRFLP